MDRIDLPTAQHIPPSGPSGTYLKERQGTDGRKEVRSFLHGVFWVSATLYKASHRQTTVDQPALCNFLPQMTCYRNTGEWNIYFFFGKEPLHYGAVCPDAARFATGYLEGTGGGCGCHPPANYRTSPHSAGTARSRRHALGE